MFHFSGCTFDRQLYAKHLNYDVSAMPFTTLAKAVKKKILETISNLSADRSFTLSATKKKWTTRRKVTLLVSLIAQTNTVRIHRLFYQVARFQISTASFLKEYTYFVSRLLSNLGDNPTRDRQG